MHRFMFTRMKKDPIKVSGCVLKHNQLLRACKVATYLLLT